jgi:hypothetical protein
MNYRTHKLKLALSKGPASNTLVINKEIIFNGLYKKLSNPKVGPKDGSYFVRGPARLGESTRKDENLESASLLILDGDSSTDPETGEKSEGAPCPLLTHEALCKLGILHVLYTSWSHKQPGKGNRYRVLIPAEIPDKETLSACVRWAIAQLHEQGIYLADVKENHAWSQAWYLPRLSSAEAEYLCLTNMKG